MVYVGVSEQPSQISSFYLQMLRRSVVLANTEAEEEDLWREKEKEIEREWRSKLCLGLLHYLCA